MKASADVLILEDDPGQLTELQRHFDARGFHPVAVRSAARAISLLRDGGAARPVLAIVDWDLSMAPDQSASSSDALCILAHEAVDCLVIVYTANVDSFAVRSAIHRAHPRAFLHDKREGDGSLLARIDRMLDHSVGDLQVHDGAVVVHLPSRATYQHREAVRLVIHHPQVVTLHSETATRAVRRFGEWLAQHGSPARVVSHGNRRYRLTVDERPDAGGPAHP
jgi:hypothetical protein